MRRNSIIKGSIVYALTDIKPAIKAGEKYIVLARDGDYYTLFQNKKGQSFVLHLGAICLFSRYSLKTFFS